MNLKQNIKAVIVPILLFSIIGCTPIDEVNDPVDNASDPVDNSTAISDENQEILARHNEIRAELYRGDAMIWDESLALSAQTHADDLADRDAFEHSATSNGENLFVAGGDTGYMEAIDGWYGEKLDYDIESDTCATDKVCGHYLQLIWQETTEVGCAKASGNKYKTIIVCHYNPRGNNSSERPFYE